MDTQQRTYEAISIPRGTKFRNQEELLSLIEEQSKLRGLPFHENLFKVQNFRVKGMKDERRRYTCGVCKRTFSLVIHARNPRGLHCTHNIRFRHNYQLHVKVQPAVEINNPQHTQSSGQQSPFDSPKVKDEPDILRSHTPNLRRRCTPTPRPYRPMLQQTQEQSPINVCPVEEHPFDMLEVWLAAHCYTHKRCQGEAVNLIMVSPHMKANYEQYSDTLYFDIVYNLVHSNAYGNYQLGFWSVVDANNRMQLAGVVFLGAESSRNIECVFRQFLAMHDKSSPETVLTSDHRGVFEGVRAIAKKVNFEHLMNPWYVIRSIGSQLIGSSSEVSAIMGQIRQALQCPDPNEFEAKCTKLLTNPISQKVFRQLLSKKPTIFFTSIFRFVGLSRTNTQQLLDELRTVRKGSISAVACKLHSLDQQLNERHREVFCGEVDLLLMDTRLAEVRLQCNRDVVERFLTNYMSAVTEYFAEEGLDNRWVVHSSSSKEVFTIAQWKCSCPELSRTGVGCPHLISAAIADGTCSYLQVVLPRWVHTEQSL